MQSSELRFNLACRQAGIQNLIFLASFFLVFWALSSALPVKAEDCPGSDICSADNYDCKIKKCQEWLDALGPAQEKNKADLANYRKQIVSLQQKISALDQSLKVTEKEIKQREADLKEQEELMAARLREMYKRDRSLTLLTILFTSRSVADFNRGLALQQTAAKEDWQIIVATADKINSLKKDQETLQRNQASLASLKAQVNKQADFLQTEVDKMEKFFADIRAQQQALLALKEGGFSTSVGDVPPADDPASRPDYNPGFSPAFAAFSFGAPHFQGLSQYGAYGRAKAGQTAEEILRAYYGGGIEIKKDYSTNINIRVSGYGTVDIETYVKRIYEVPTSWGENGGFEALKAQAVAARSYALAATNNGSVSICATEDCQVYKPANKGGKWDEAVEATRGWVLMVSGKPFLAKYAASSGGHQTSYTYNGYTTPSFWDTTSDWQHWAEGAWEVKGGSPWFYKAWYKTRSGQACGRSHPWLTQEEFADILNAAIVYANNGDTSGIFPTDSCLSNAVGWSKDKMAAEADKYGGRITSITDISVIHSENGSTKSVVFNTNRGAVTLAGNVFYKVFNLRAPGAISLKSDLFNILKK